MFDKLGSIPDVKNGLEEDFKQIGKFFVVLYNSALNTEDVSVARRVLINKEQP